MTREPLKKPRSEVDEQKVLDIYLNPDKSILDALVSIQWEAVEIDQYVGLENKVEEIHIIHEKGSYLEMRKLVWLLRKMEKDIERALFQTSLFLYRPVGTGRSDVDFSYSHL